MRRIDSIEFASRADAQAWLLEMIHMQYCLDTLTGNLYIIAQWSID